MKPIFEPRGKEVRCILQNLFFSLSAYVLPNSFLHARLVARALNNAIASSLPVERSYINPWFPSIFGYKIAIYSCIRHDPLSFIPPQLTYKRKGEIYNAEPGKSEC